MCNHHLQLQYLNHCFYNFFAYIIQKWQNSQQKNYAHTLHSRIYLRQQWNATTMQYACSINSIAWTSYSAMQDSRFWQWHFWSFKSSWCDPELFSKWLPTFWSIQTVPVSELFLKCLTPNMSPSKYQKLLTQWHTITSHKTWSFTLLCRGMP
jgi:hypothetical protein